MDWVSPAAAIVAVIVAGVSGIMNATWRVSQRTTGFVSRKEQSDAITLATDNIGEALRGIRTQFEILERDFKKAELWNRDNLVSRNDFSKTDLSEIKERLGVIELKANTTWNFIMDRAAIEARERGWMVKKSPLTLNEEGLAAIAPILPTVKAWCNTRPEITSMTKDELEVTLASVFRDQLREEICEPNGIYMGACIVILIEALRLEKVIH